MKRFVPVLLAAGFAITLAGCTPAKVAVSINTNTSSTATDDTSSALTLVTLKVPNMV